MDTQNSADGDRDAPDLDAASSEDAAYRLAFAERVRALRGAMSRSDFAHAIGIHQNTVGKFERGETMPDAMLITKMCRVGKRSAGWLLSGEEEPRSDIPGRSLVSVEFGDFVWVPLFDIQVSAGGGAFNEIERVVAMRPFDLRFIRHELRIPHNHMAMLQIVGDSASPRLNSKDSVLVDRQDRDVLTEGMHVVRLDGALFAKRLQRLPGRVLRVTSANEAYAPFEISGSEEMDRDFEVIGRVRWGGVIFQ